MDIINTKFVTLKPIKHKKIKGYSYISYSDGITPYHLNYENSTDFYKEFEEVFLKIEYEYYDLYYTPKHKDLKELVYDVLTHSDTRKSGLKISCKLFKLNNHYIGYNQNRYWILFKENSNKLEILKIYDKDTSIKSILNNLSFEKEFDDTLLTDVIEKFYKNIKLAVLKTNIIKKEKLIEMFKEHDMKFLIETLEKTDFSKKHRLDLMEVTYHCNSKILDKKINDALEKVEGINTDEEIINHYTKKLDQIPELTSKMKKNILKGIIERFNAPKPKPEDYFFKFSPELTSNPTMRGEHTPIFLFKVNKEGPNKGKFGMGELFYILETYGFSVISNNVFAWEKGKIKDEDNYKVNIIKADETDAETARNILLEHGFIEQDFSNTLNLKRTAKEVNPEEFLNRLFGDGTSTNAATESYGKKAYSDGFPDIEEDMDSYIGIKEKAMCLDTTRTVDVDYAKMANILQKALEKYKDKKITYSHYIGYKDREVCIINSVDDDLIYESCVNIKELSKIKNANNYSYAVIRNNIRYKGYAVFKTTEGCHIIQI